MAEIEACPVRLERSGDDSCVHTVLSFGMSVNSLGSVMLLKVTEGGGRTRRRRRTGRRGLAQRDSLIYCVSCVSMQKKMAGEFLEVAKRDSYRIFWA